MPLKAKIVSLSDVSDDQHGLYRPLPDNGGFILDVVETEGFALENISGLRNTLQTQKKDLQSLKDSAQAFNGVDVSTLRSDLKELAKLRELDPSELSKEAVQLAIDQEKQKYEGLFNDFETRDVESARVISGLLVDTSAIKALAESGGSAKLLLPHIKSQCKVLRQEDGSRVVQVFDHNGNPRIAIENGQTRDFTIQDLIDEMRNDDTFSVAFDVKGKGGSGGPSDHTHRRETGNRVIHDVGHESISSNLEDIATGKAVVEAA